MEEIIAASHTSKGSFYHYFGKDALLATLSDLFDQKYQDLQPTPWTRPCPRWTSFSSSTGPCFR